MLTSLLKTITKGKDLSERESAIVMEQIMEGTISDVQLAAFLAALTTKGASEREITAFARTMRKYSMHVPCTMDVFDIVGTGGGRTKTFNISTTASFVIAAGGVRVAKHGNRAKTSRSGSADVLETLGANIFLSPESCLDMLGQIGLCYFYTRYYYYMMKRIDAVREQLGIYTVFDVLRPLTNPAHAVYEILGVNAPHLVEPMAHVLAALGVRHGMVVYGQDGSDEISASAATTICEFTPESFSTYEIRPEDFNLPRASRDELRGGLPYGIALGLDYPLALAAAVLGNMVPVPFIILYIRHIFHWLQKQNPWWNERIEALERKAHLKGRLVRKYRTLGLCVLVVIPLPGTGAWTGALVAAVLDMRLKDAVPTIFLGVCIASAIMTVVTYGAIHIL